MRYGKIFSFSCFIFFITAKLKHEKILRNVVLIKLKRSRNMTKYYVKELLCPRSSNIKRVNDMLSQKFRDPTVNNCDI